MKVTSLLVVVTAASMLVLGGCDDTKSGEAAPGASAKPAAAESDKSGNEPEDKGAGGALEAATVGKPVGDWQKEDIEEALKKGGWKITGSTATKSAMLNIIVRAEKAGTEAYVKYYKNGSDIWKDQIVNDGGATHEEGDVLVGVIIKNDKKGAKQLLDSLVGA